MENCGSAVKCVISFLRGQLINHDTQPNASTYPIEARSPPFFAELYPLVIVRTDKNWSLGISHWSSVHCRTDYPGDRLLRQFPRMTNGQ